MTECEYCGGIFTGASRRKDAERHLRHQHGISHQNVADVYRYHSRPVGKQDLASPSLHSSQRLEHNMDYLMECLDPSAHPARVNDFFNGLDIIVADLEDREYVQKPMVLTHTDLPEQQSY
jgi:hypothetical protein